RIINAGFRLGTKEQLLRMFRAAAKLKSERIRLIALERISQWGEPHPVDRSVGLYRPVPKRDLKPLLPDLLAGIGELIKNANGKVLARS
ncbi:MAG: hypothetical protein QF886_27470, partial [Planctomycetota bacterium]|nr:hypothetical protein [Planctomycetota bacterium]